jgi:hypothetical protein
MTQADGGGSVSYLDALVPPERDERDLFERLLRLGLRDDHHRVDLGPLDEATLNIVVRSLHHSGRNLLLVFPRGRHDLAVLLGIYLQLRRRGARLNAIFGPDSFDGPIVVVGLNTNLTDRLRRIKIGGTSLSDGLAARRVRSDGSVVDLAGHLSRALDWPEGLLYLNTSLGWPRLRGVKPGVVVIDRATFSNPLTMERALEWAAAQQSRRVIVIGEHADLIEPQMSDERIWLRWVWTPGLRTDVVAEVGSRRCCGPLSTNPLLVAPPQRLGSVVYRAPAIARLRRRIMATVRSAKRPGRPFPRPLVDLVRLVRTLDSLWGTVENANYWAAAEPRGATIAALVRSVQATRSDQLGGFWETFAETQWPELRLQALEFAELISAFNPRLDVLAALLDWAAQERPGRRIVIRTHARWAAGALLADLVAAYPRFEPLIGDGDDATEAVAALAYSDRLPWAQAPCLEVHLGVPAPWHRTALLSAEATEHLVVVDEDEVAWLSTIVDALDDDATSAVNACADVLGLDLPQVVHIQTAEIVFGPVAIDSRGEDEPEPLEPMPRVDLGRLFASFTAVQDLQDDATAGDQATEACTSGRLVLARPVTLSPGDSVYWLPLDGRAEVLVGERYSTVAVADLTPGTRLLLPRGESREQLYERLLLAARQDVDLQAVSLLLRRFRIAVRELHDRYDSWDGVARELSKWGSDVSSGQTCRSWTTGDVIAPADIQDIQRVGRLAWNDSLLLDGTWRRIGRGAEELRRLHQRLGNIVSRAISEAVSGRPGPNLARLSQECGGIDATEILEEFDIRLVQRVGQSASIPTGQLRRLIVAASANRPA